VAQCPQARLLIVGDGSLRGALEKEAENLGIMPYTIFAGARRDIPELLASMDVFALSSDNEGMPVAILEAMAAGLPIVATAVGGISDAIKHEETGFLVVKGSRECFTKALSRVLCNPGQAAEVGTRARAFVCEHYGLTATMNSYFRIYTGKQN
jgi:glycosyltransferase involved in cell wall biosynthesis